VTRVIAFSFCFLYSTIAVTAPDYRTGDGP
jgi:hypothetical protein